MTDSVLRYGSEGFDVGVLRSLLLGAGFNAFSADANRRFDWHLYVRVLQFQIFMWGNAHDWSIDDMDGIVGPKTWAALRKQQRVPNPPTTPQSPEASVWEKFIKALSSSELMPPAIKLACMAQAIVETGRGKSTLARGYNNFHGIKWRPEMANMGALPVIVPVASEAEGEAEFCSFPTPAHAVKGYWAFLQRSPYEGYKAHMNDVKSFLRFVCRIWATDPKYTEKCLSVLEEAAEILKQSSPNTPQPEQPEEPMQRPDSIKESPNQSERGATLTHVVLHNTAGSYGGALSWLCNRESKVSAHLVVSRKAHVTQLVQFDKKAWHAGNARMNANSIGIEIEATVSQRGMTPEQETKVVAWVRQLMALYNIPAENVGIHRWFSETSCPGLIWPTDDEFRAWRKKHLGS